MPLPTHVSTSPPNQVQRTFSRNNTIPLRPDALWRIERGAVRTLTWSEEGTSITLGYWGPGDVVGQPLSTIQPHQIECVTSVEVSYIPPNRWDQTVDAICSHVQQVEELLSIVRSERVQARLLKFLGWLTQKFGREVNEGQLIELRLTHQAIAEAIGTSRVTVTRLLNQFEDEGIISRHRRHFIVLHSQR